MRAELPKDKPLIESGDHPADVLLAKYGPQYTSGIVGGVFRPEPLWQATHPSLSMSFPPPATLFLHERFTPTGERRLVAVEMDSMSLEFGHVEITVIHPAGWWSEQRDKKLTHFWEEKRADFWSDSRVSTTVLESKWYAGWPDPDNPSRLTIHGIVGQQSLDLEITLRDDDTVDVRKVLGGIAPSRQ